MCGYRLKKAHAPRKEKMAGSTLDTHFGFFLDDVMDGLFHELERVQDGNSAHRVAFKAPTKEQAVQILCERIKPFLLNKMYLCDEYGSELDPQ